jgi:hypothetical protein
LHPLVLFRGASRIVLPTSTVPVAGDGAAGAVAFVVVSAGVTGVTTVVDGVVVDGVSHTATPP